MSADERSGEAVGTNHAGSGKLLPSFQCVGLVRDLVLWAARSCCLLQLSLGFATKVEFCASGTDTMLWGFSLNVVILWRFLPSPSPQKGHRLLI